MVEKHVVVGAGPVGTATAERLVERGHEVLLVSRSGRGPEVPGARREAVDVAEPGRLVAAAQGAVALYNCVNPPSYDRWQEEWPPVAAAFLEAAEKTGVVLAVVGNLYPYGPVDGPMREGLPDAATTPKARLRGQMWADALALHEAGRIRVVEVRGSDYVGPRVAPQSGHVSRVAAKALQGETVWVVGRPDVPHSFTDVRDVARAVVTLAAEPSSWGRVWHAPTNPARTQAETLADVAGAVGRRTGAVRGTPRAVLRVGGLVVPMLRELQETEYQFTRPYVLDSGAIAAAYGLEPTPWAEVCRATAEDALAR